MPRQRLSETERTDVILSGAAKLFRDKGIADASIDQIVSAAGIAKGTFYLYFKSKDALVEKLAGRLVERMVEAAKDAGNSDRAALDRFAAAVGAIKKLDLDERYLSEALDRPENGALHEQVNIALVRQLGPVLADIVEAGNSEGLFDVADALSTVQFLLAGQAMLLGGGRLVWSAEEYAARLTATLTTIERALGAAPGTLAPRLAEALGAMQLIHQSGQEPKP